MCLSQETAESGANEQQVKTAKKEAEKAKKEANDYKLGKKKADAELATLKAQLGKDTVTGVTNCPD